MKITTETSVCILQPCRCPDDWACHCIPTEWVYPVKAIGYVWETDADSELGSRLEGVEGLPANVSLPDLSDEEMENLHLALEEAYLSRQSRMKRLADDMQRVVDELREARERHTDAPIAERHGSLRYACERALEELSRIAKGASHS